MKYGIFDMWSIYSGAVLAVWQYFRDIRSFLLITDQQNNTKEVSLVKVFLQLSPHIPIDEQCRNFVEIQSCLKY